MARIKDLIVKYTICEYIGLYIKKVIGAENIPKENGFLIVSNHNSICDSLGISQTMLKYTDRLPSVIAKIVSRKKSIFDRIIVRISNTLAQLLVEIISVLKEKVIEKSVIKIKKGRNLLIFPEGKNNTKSQLLKAKTGAARIALQARCPVLPVGVINTENIIPNGKMLPRFNKATIVIGKPLTFEEYYGKEEDREKVKEVTRIIMKEVGNLCNKEYSY